MARQKNRRRERRHVLDVKLSVNQLRRRRTQVLASGLGAFVLLLGIIYGLWRGGWWVAQHFVYRNEHLQVREFNVRTDGVIDPAHLKRWAGVKTNDNLFAIDLHAIKRQLETHGLIRQASLERVLPGTLNLRVTERVPLARVRLRYGGADGESKANEFGLDAAGRVLPLEGREVRPEAAAAWHQLTELTGLNLREIIPGIEVTNRQVRAALAFLEEFKSANMRRVVRVTEIDVARPATLQLTTVNGNLTSLVKVLNSGFGRQLARWEEFHKFCLSNRVHYPWVDLSPTNNLPTQLVRLAAAPTAATGQP